MRPISAQVLRFPLFSVSPLLDSPLFYLPRVLSQHSHLLWNYMDSHITEVMNSMSPQGSLIVFASVEACNAKGNASEVLSESVAQDESANSNRGFIFVDCTISRIHETGEEISHSPTTVFHGDDLFLSDNDLSAVEDPQTEDVSAEDWSSFSSELEMTGICE